MEDPPLTTSLLAAKNKPLQWLASIFYVNAISIVNKIDEFQLLIYTIFIGISETWLTSEIFDNEVLLSGYVLFSNDRPSCGGGVMLVVKNHIPCQILTSPSDIEIVSAKLDY